MSDRTRFWGEWADVLPDDVVTEAGVLLEDATARAASLPDGPIIDVHAHLGRDRDGHTLTADDLIADLDRHGIARAVCFAANEPGEGRPFEVANAAVCEAAAKHPGRIVAFCRVDPRRDPHEVMSRAADQGAQGLKLHPVSQRFAIDAPETIAVVRDATDRGWPVLFHAGFGARALAGPLEALCCQVPGHRIILAHGARGDARAVAELAMRFPNVWFDTSLAALADLVALPPSRIVFGADRPYGEFATALQLVSLAADLAGWTADDVAGVLWGNAQSLVRQA